MDKNEASKEIEDFLRFNAEDIRGLMQLNPDLLTAFNGVVSAIDQQYGVGSLGTIDSIVNAPQPNKPIYSKNFTTDFVIGDYLNDVNTIYIPFKISNNDGTISDIEYEIGGNFNGFEDTLIIRDIYEIDGKIYYATIYQKDINFFEDEIINKNYKTFLFEVGALDSHYFDYFENAGKTKFPIGSYILCPSLPQKQREDLFGNFPKLRLYQLFKTKENMLKVTSDNGTINAMNDLTNAPSEVYESDEVMIVKDVQNSNGKNYYLLDSPNGGPYRFAYESTAFDDCFGKLNSIKNNSIFTRTRSFGVENYYWFKSLNFSNNYIMYKMTNFNGIMSIVDIVDEMDVMINFHYSWFENTDIYKMTPFECREFIADYEKNNPMITKIMGANKNVVSATRPDYMSKSIPNDGTRKSPTTSATLFDVGNLMIGSDGFLWEITEDKNGTKRWKSKENVLKNLNADIFPNEVPNPLYNFPLTILQKNESSMEKNLGFFDPKSGDYKEMKGYLDANKQYLMYYPNIDLNS